MSVAMILEDKGRDVVTCAPAVALRDVASILSERGIGAIVVTDEERRIAGVISERDIVGAVGKLGARALDLPAEKVMTREVTTCHEEDSIEVLAAKMTAGRFRHLPVVEDGKLVGIISIGDVVKRRIERVEMEAAAMREYIATG